MLRSWAMARAPAVRWCASPLHTLWRANTTPSRRGSMACMPADGLSAQSTTPSLSDTAAHGGNPMAGSALHYGYTPLHQNIICAETAIATLPATVDALGARRA